MAFVIKNIRSGQSSTIIAAAIQVALQTGGRFTACVSTLPKRVEIREVRLTYNKDYCGNHPFACPVRPGGHRAHKKLKYLEGSDWVGFNDLLNDVLDSLRVICDAASSHVIIRKAGARCMRYDGQPNGIGNEWIKDSGVFKNCMGIQNIQARFPSGTPGFATAHGQPNYTEHTH